MARKYKRYQNIKMGRKIKKQKKVCNICLNKSPDTKCNICKYECCFDCIYTWSKITHKCPQCNKPQTYNIHYLDAEDMEDAEDDDLHVRIPVIRIRLLPIEPIHIPTSDPGDHEDP